MFYEKLAEAKEEKKRLSAKQKLGLGLGTAGVLTAGILGRKRLGNMFRRNAPDTSTVPTSTLSQTPDDPLDATRDYLKQRGFSEWLVRHFGDEDLAKLTPRELRRG